MESFPVLTTSLAEQARTALMQASEARQTLAQSWRNYHVGGCAIFGTADDPQAMISAGNLNPEEYGAINIHTEEALLAMATEMKLGQISVLAIVGDLQPDSRTGEIPPALLPCAERCIGLLESSYHITDDTLLVSASPDLQVVQFYNMKHLIEVRNS